MKPLELEEERQKVIQVCLLMKEEFEKNGIEPVIAVKGIIHYLTLIFRANGATAQQFNDMIDSIKEYYASKVNE